MLLPFDGRRHLLPFPGSLPEASQGECPVPIKPMRMKMIQNMNLRMTKAAPVAAKA
ncbi:hypothetical protein DY000_02058673 [Brassica cretica]|uniref:Uncharacterized protein n=1 Tax=Brassica cretica TaxID=69181 RepID=A0ABQ7AU07_BRACR|nr:hypothetical protein DY000_02058673 [Brassica cretica]